MKLPPQIEQEGLIAYEQVGAFEDLQRRRLPAIYGGLTLLFVICGGAMLLANLPAGALLCLGIAILFPLWAGFEWWRLRLRYQENRRRLAELESQYGDQLPWLQVERHFAALEQLRADLAEEKRKAEERRAK